MEESGTPDQEVRPDSLNGSTTEELKLTEETTSTSPVHGTCEDISVVHSAVTKAEKVSPKGSMASEVGVSHVPVPWGRLTKVIVMDTFKDVHTGLGTLGPPLYISMNPKVTPIQAHPHRCPVAKDIEVPKLPIPTVDELLPKLNNAKIISCVDVYKGFTNIELDESSSFLTTMHTPIGRYRWLRMPFGISLGPEEYQRGQHEALEGLTDVVNKADDILVFGSGDSIEEAEKDHDINLWNLMLRCREVNLKLNPKKLQFKVKQVTLMGHLISSNGITPHPDRVQAIKDMTPPQDVKGVQRFLGICNYLSRFTPNLAEVVKPLTELAHVVMVLPA